MSSTPNYTDLLSAYGAYPPAIRPYLIYADTLEEIRIQLTKSTRLAFLDLVARTNIARPQQPIMVRVDHTAEKLGISTKSVSRAIKLMIENGWLEASKQHDGRNNNGEFAWREFIVTPALRALLRIAAPGRRGSDDDCPPPPSSTSTVDRVEPTKDEATFSTADENANSSDTGDRGASAPLNASREAFDKVAKALSIVTRRAALQLETSKQSPALPTPVAEGSRALPWLVQMPVPQPSDNVVQADEKVPSATVLSDGPIYAVNKVFIKKEASLQKGAFEKEASFEKAIQPQDQKSKAIRIPVDLREMMAALDILPQGICSLMALAKKTGQRLQDVWKAKKDTLLNSGAKNGRAVKYIRFLLNCGEDFSYIARTKIDSPSKPQTPANFQRSAEAASQPEPAQEIAASPATTNNKPRTPASPAGTIVGGQIDHVVKASRHKRFRHISKGVTVRVFDGTAEVIAGAKSVILGGWSQMQQIYLDIVLGNLVEVKQ
jgi:hypothetical protein